MSRNRNPELAEASHRSRSARTLRSLSAKILLGAALVSSAAPNIAAAGTSHEKTPNAQADYIPQKANHKLTPAQAKLNARVQLWAAHIAIKSRSGPVKQHINTSNYGEDIFETISFGKTNDLNNTPYIVTTDSKMLPNGEPDLKHVISVGINSGNTANFSMLRDYYTGRWSLRADYTPVFGGETRTFGAAVAPEPKSIYAHLTPAMLNAFVSQENNVMDLALQGTEPPSLHAPKAMLYAEIKPASLGPQ